ncbi:MAG: hypothetical protein KDJ38_17035 [Gammaproteobacteria bacterium]|nr:hypothetical protein [Gammaproteobacteria bacterium]
MRDYLALLARRKYHILIPFLLLMGAGIALAYLLPPVYKSQATILVKDAEIPSDIIKTTVTGYLQQRIEEIKQRTLTRQGLLDIARQIDYYSGSGKPTPPEVDIVKDMRESIIVEMVEVRASDPASSRASAVTVAFTVAFEAADPLVAKRGARAITNLIIEENKALRQGAVEGVSEFLVERVTSAKRAIEEVEERLTEFKSKHVNELPEQVDSNRMLLEQTEAKVERTDESIRELEDRAVTLSGQLSYTSPYKDVFTDDQRRVQTGNERLNVLTAEYKQASARYSPDHPEVKKLRRELQAMVGQLGPASGAGQMLNELIEARDELARAEQRYSAAHPDVRRLSAKVSQLESDLTEAAATSISSGSSNQVNAAVRPSNPVYVNLQTQLDNVNAQLRSERLKRERLVAKIDEYESRVVTSPLVEQEYRALVNELEARKLTYQDLNEKRIKAELASKLEEGGKSERFDVVDPAVLPTKPDRPNRLGIALLSFLIAISAGIGAAAIGEYTDKTIYGSKGLVAAFGAQPIAVIPNIPDRAVAGTATTRVAQGLATAIVIVLIASAVLFLYQMNKPAPVQGGSDQAVTSQAQ